MKKSNLLLFGFILLVLVGSIQFLTVFAGDPVPGIDISLEEIPGGIKIDLGGYQTEHGIVIGTAESQNKDFAVVLDIIPLSNFQQNVQDELMVSKNIRKNISTVTKQADSPYEFYATSPGHKSVEELTLYRVSLNSADSSNEELKSYIVKRIEQQEQVRGGYIGGKGGDGSARVSEKNAQLVTVCNGCTIGELLQMIDYNSSRSNIKSLVIICDDCTIEDVLEAAENHNSSRSQKTSMIINCVGCNINEGTYGAVGEQGIDVIKATTKAQREQSEANAAQVGIKEEGIKKIPSSEKRPAVPNWIKNIAEWFSQGVISEDDFVKGLEWMINNGIIRIESVGIKEEGVK
ncbi:MAG: hypothetical protein WD154_02200 [Nitrosopumilaceae archaeon]